MTTRLSIINLAGMARTLVAVGTSNDAFMFLTTAADAPRSTWFSSSGASADEEAAGLAGAAALAGAGSAAAGAGAGVAGFGAGTLGAGAGAAGAGAAACAASGWPLAAGAASPTGSGL